jgi:hypothetical protein
MHFFALARANGMQTAHLRFPVTAVEKSAAKRLLSEHYPFEGSLRNGAFTRKAGEALHPELTRLRPARRSVKPTNTGAAKVDLAAMPREVGFSHADRLVHAFFLLLILNRYWNRLKGTINCIKR